MNVLSQAKREAWAKAHPLMLVTVAALSLVPPAAVVLYLRGASLTFSLGLIAIALIAGWLAGFAELRARGRRAGRAVRSLRRLGGYRVSEPEEDESGDDRSTSA
jgi:hypothetical protein